MSLKQRKNKTTNGVEKDKHNSINKGGTKTKNSSTLGTRERSRWQRSSQQAIMVVVVLSFTILAVSVIFSRNNDDVHITSTVSPTTSSKATKERKKTPPAPPSTRFGSFEILETVPHDGDSFTQGLQIVEDTLYESAGRYGKSDLRRVDLSTGTVLQRTALPEEFFGEGITYFEDSGKGRILQLTWRERTAFLYDSESLKLLDRFSYDTETGDGWGITWRQQQSTFIVSDGSPFLHIWDSQTFAEIKRVEVYTFVHGGTGKVRGINELEYEPVSDTLLANVWHNDLIMRIDPDTGFVKTMYDLRNLYPSEQRSSTDTEAVLNGIALVPGQPDQVWVTGKLWSHMFRIRLVEPEE